MDVIGNLTLIIAHSGIFHLVLHFPDKRMAVKGQEIVQDSKAIFKVHSDLLFSLITTDMENKYIILNTELVERAFLSI